MLRTLYIIAWEYGSPDSCGGGGFNWYPTQEGRDKAWPQEEKNMQDPDLHNWRAIKFTAEVNATWDAPTITSELDDLIWANSLADLDGTTQKLEELK